MVSLTLPKFEQFEEAQQIRRSCKSNKNTNIVMKIWKEAKYKQDFIRFLIIAQASNDETIDHLEMLYETKSLTDQKLF
ncbi:MAG: four helix bundle protein [Flammeovirgaceae bacterium]|nr:four helix bundle protein [Flammeovirgaceae bacterium]